MVEQRTQYDKHLSEVEENIHGVRLQEVENKIGFI